MLSDHCPPSEAAKRPEVSYTQKAILEAESTPVASADHVSSEDTTTSANPSASACPVASAASVATTGQEASLNTVVASVAEASAGPVSLIDIVNENIKAYCLPQAYQGNETAQRKLKTVLDIMGRSSRYTG
jgi:hypothetical protein